jgi:hypothetical protein
MDNFITAIRDFVKDAKNKHPRIYLTLFIFICCLGISGLILLASQIDPTKSGIKISDSLQNICFNFFLLALVIVFFHFGQDVKTSLEKEGELTFETAAIQVLKGKAKGMHYLDIWN